MQGACKKSRNEYDLELPTGNAFISCFHLEGVSFYVSWSPAKRASVDLQQIGALCL